jgi:hypothetical protein
MRELSGEGSETLCAEASPYLRRRLRKGRDSRPSPPPTYARDRPASTSQGAGSVHQITRSARLFSNSLKIRMNILSNMNQSSLI